MAPTIGYSSRARGLDATTGRDAVFEQMVIARIIEPASVAGSESEDLPSAFK